MLRRYVNLYVLEILELGYVIFFFFGRFFRIYRGVFSLKMSCLTHDPIRKSRQNTHTICFQICDLIISLPYLINIYNNFVRFCKSTNLFHEKSLIISIYFNLLRFYQM